MPHSVGITKIERNGLSTGGAATDGVRPILTLQPESIHQRTPLVFGSIEKVERVARYHTDPNSSAERSPLFGRRGLLRA